MSTTFLTLLSVFLVSTISLGGLFFLSMREQWLKRILLYLVSFATGALFANVFGHLLPEIVAESSNVTQSMQLVLYGIFFSFILERFIHWHHCHTLDCEEHVHPVGKMVLIGDGAHNITDGILIATAYLVSVPVGIATTIAVALHELPQEIGDFSILLHSGYSRGKALFYNFCSALTALLGAIGVLLLHDKVDGIELWLLPLTAGNFLYIAGTDLIPELHKEVRLDKAFLQLLCMIAGALLLFGIVERHDPHAELGHDHSHGQEEELHDEEESLHEHEEEIHDHE